MPIASNLGQLLKSNRFALLVRLFMSAQIIFAIEMFTHGMRHDLTSSLAAYLMKREMLCTILGALFMFLGRNKNEVRISHLFMIAGPMVFVAMIFLHVTYSK